HQLHDDGSGDIRHDAECEHREALKRTTREHVEQAQDTALVLLEHVGQRIWIDARYGNVSSQAKNHQGEDQEHNTAFQIAVFRTRFTLCLSFSHRCPLSQRAAGSFDCGASAGRCCNAFQYDLACQFAGFDDLGVTDSLTYDTRLLEHLYVDFVDGQTLQIGQTHFGKQMLTQWREATLGQTALQRHLTALEADLMETAGTRFLTFVATASGFTQARADAATDTAASMLGAFGWFQRIKLSF